MPLIDAGKGIRLSSNNAQLDLVVHMCCKGAIGFRLGQRSRSSSAAGCWDAVLHREDILNSQEPTQLAPDIQGKMNCKKHVVESDAV